MFAPIRLLLVSSILLSPCIARAQDMEHQRLEQLAQATLTAEPPLLAYPMLLSLDEFRELLPLSVLDAWYAELSQKPQAPLVDVLLRRSRCELSLSQGQVDVARSCFAELGYLTRGHVLGPFANDGMSGFDAAYAPEEAIEINTAVDGRFDGLRWLAFDAPTPLLAFSDAIWPAQDAVVYFATVLEADRTREALLWLGADGAYAAWLNGQLVAREDDDLGFLFERDAYRLSLKAGPNLLVLKVASGSRVAASMLRLSQEDGSPLMLPHGRIEPARSNALDSSPDKLRTAPSVLDQLEQLSPPHARIWAAYARHRLSPEDPTSSARNLLLEALDGYDPEPHQVLLATRILDEEWRSQRLLDQALQRSPNDPWLLSEQVLRWLRGSAFDRADELKSAVEQLLDTQSESITPALLRIELLRSDRLDVAAFERASELARARPGVLRVQRTLHQCATAIDDFEAQRRALDQLLTLDAFSEHWRVLLARSELARGDTGSALNKLAEGLSSGPARKTLRGLHIDLLDALDRSEEADRSLEQAIAACPSCADWHQRRGDRLLERGLAEQALDAYRLALDFEVHNESLRQLVRYLDPASESFEQPYLLENVESVEATGYSDDYLVLLDQKLTLLHPNGLSSTYVQTVYQPLTEAGVAALRRIPIYYTPDDELLEIDMLRVSRADGSQFETYERSERSVSDESIRMYYDYRQVQLGLAELGVGDRIELRYRRSQVARANFLEQHFGDVWYMQDLVPKLHQRYVLIAPANRSLYFRFPDSFESETQAGRARYEQRLEQGRQVHLIERFDAARLRVERMMPGWAEVAEYLLVSTFSSWTEVASVYWNLAKDQWIVDKDIRDAVNQLIAGIDDRRERVRRIHNYVVKNTRYVALEFGIHGYKPYRTTVSFRRRFGDCKDKASLMKVMLEEAGIAAYIVLIRTNQNGDIATEPASLSIFDHAIAYVPEFDLFLDGTAEFSGTSELPSMDEGATLLIVKENGEHELRTSPVSSADDNLMVNDYLFRLRSDGAELSGKSSIKGLFAAGYRQRFESVEKQRDAFEDELSGDFPGASVRRVDFANVDSLEQPVAFDFEADIGSLLIKVGEGFHLPPIGKASLLTQALVPSATREHEFVLPFTLGFSDRLVYELAPELELSELPEGESIVSAFGRLDLAFEARGNVIEVRADLRITQRRISVADYNAFQRFIMNVDRALNTPIRIVSKEANR